MFRTSGISPPQAHPPPVRARTARRRRPRLERARDTVSRAPGGWASRQRVGAVQTSCGRLCTWVGRGATSQLGGGGRGGVAGCCGRTNVAGQGPPRPAKAPGGGADVGVPTGRRRTLARSVAATQQRLWMLYLVHLSYPMMGATTVPWVWEARGGGGDTGGPPKRWRRAVGEWDSGPPPAAPVSIVASTVRLAAASGTSARQARARAVGQPSRGAPPPPGGPPAAGRPKRAAPDPRPQGHSPRHATPPTRPSLPHWWVAATRRRD